MTVETAIKSKTDAAATTAGSRIYALAAPQQITKPYVVYNRVSSSKEPLLASDSDVARARFQFNAYDDTFEGAVALAEELRVVWQRFSGTVGAVEILDCAIENRVDGYDDDLDLYVISTDIMIMYRE